MHVRDQSLMHIHVPSFRCEWANYFDLQGVDYAFYSAASVVALQQARQEVATTVAQNGPGTSGHSGESTDSSDTDSLSPDNDDGTDESDQAPESDTDTEDACTFNVEPECQDPRARILSVAELEDLFQRRASDGITIFLSRNI